ncbi:MAG: sulfite exporter TauE/SafE family protein [Acidimicrobiia bacterium]|nr:sulfite exporter TauE/SafE family protein [Acidimicrobiia bacterium]
MEIPWFKAVIIGITAGFLSGLLGIGGGVVIVPAFVLWLKIDQFHAAATSVATIVITASAALITFGVGGAVDWRAGAIIFIGSATGAWLGARYLDRIPEWSLAAMFSAVMTIGAVRMWF